MDMTTLVTTLITVILGVIAAFVVPWLRLKTGVGQWEQLVSAARVAVLAAEQMHNAGLLRIPKLEYALDCVSLALEKQGFSFDADVVAAAIEAAVKEMKDSAGC